MKKFIKAAVTCGSPVQIGDIELDYYAGYYRVSRYSTWINEVQTYENGMFEDFEDAWVFFQGKIALDNVFLEPALKTLHERGTVGSILENAAASTRIKELIIHVDDALAILRKD